MIRRLTAAASALLIGFAAPGAARSAAACGASPPAAGALIRGPVLQVIDAWTVCVALGPLPEQWLALKLSSPSQGLFAQTVVCKVTLADAGHAQGVCERVAPGAPALVQTDLTRF